MSLYEVHRVCRLLRADQAFLERFQREPLAALEPYRLTNAERRALARGDVARLHALGAHGYLLGNLMRSGVVNFPTYLERVRAPLPDE